MQGYPGSVCPPDVSFARFAFNQIQPPSLRFKDALIGNQFGISNVPWAFKRLTHKEGWMSLLPTGENYHMSFEDAQQILNISYEGIFYELAVSFIFLFANLCVHIMSKGFQFAIQL